MKKKQAAIKKITGSAYGNSRKQRHVHEFAGSTRLAEEGNDRHNHRFAGVTGQAKRKGKSHVHEIDLTHTDFFGHFHNLKKITSGPAVRVGKGKHVHFVHGRTTLEDGHVHPFKFATLIESPLTK
ncbi:YmaF family protein [Paenibacillus sp. R14(2021)]|uniref:YmaF family protein n=1 Tax=Paenibacillus sp. R14(2021) TaxID=2859228 RepID=UPI001C613BD8|nr:YmaF family protein [Paenibacillus sp. R14(2021)]